MRLRDAFRQDHAAIAALAGPHADPRGALQVADRQRTVRQRFVDLAQRDLLAAADQRVGRCQLNAEARGGVKAPQPFLEAAMAGELVLGARLRFREGNRTPVAKLQRGGMAGNRAFGEGGARTDEAGAVADAEHAIDAGPALFVCHDDELPAPIVEFVAAAQGAQDLVRGLETMAETDGVDLEQAVGHAFPRWKGRDMGREPTARDLVDPRDRRTVDDRDMAKCGAIFQAFENQARYGAGHAKEGGQRRRGGHWRNLDDGGDVGTAAQQLACHLEVQRAVSGQENALAGEAPVASPQGLRRTGGHHARQGPTRHRRHPFIGAGGDDQPLGIEAANRAGRRADQLPSARRRPRFRTPGRMSTPRRRALSRRRAPLDAGDRPAATRPSRRPRVCL